MAKAIVVGAGGISNAWFKPLKAEDVDVVAVVDLNKANAEQRIAEHELNAKATDDLDKALADHPSDFVVDLTIPDAHCEVTCESLETGRHVIGEKPMAATFEQARRMVAAAEKTRKLYMVSQSRRYNARHEQVRRTLETGAIGPVTHAHCDFFMGCHFGGFRDEMEHVLLNDMSIHHFDLMRMFTGLDPVAVYAEEYNPHGSWYAHGPNANCLFEMTGGVRFTYRGSWCAEGCHTSWNGDWRITGPKGTYIFEQDQPPRGQVVAGDEGFNRPLTEAPIADEPQLKGNGQHGALIEFLAAIDGGPTPQGECRDNIKSMAMVSAAIESAATGQRIDITKMLT